MRGAIGKLRAGFEEGVERLLAQTPALAHILEDLDAEQIQRYGRDAARQALAPLVWRAAAGDALTTQQIQSLLGVSRQALHKRVAAGTLLGLPAERTTLYPAWQFEGSNVRPVVEEIIAALREGLEGEYDARLVASWAHTGQPELRGRTPAEWLVDGRDSDAVVRAAERAAAALAN